MELAVIGVIGQIVALRFLVVQAAKRPEDPRLWGDDDHTPTVDELREREAARRTRIFWGIVAFWSTTAVALIGLLLLFLA